MTNHPHGTGINNAYSLFKRGETSRHNLQVVADVTCYKRDCAVPVVKSTFEIGMAQEIAARVEPLSKSPFP